VYTDGPKAGDDKVDDRLTAFAESYWSHELLMGHLWAVITSPRPSDGVGLMVSPRPSDGVRG
jgi:hypothetical protein